MVQKLKIALFLALFFLSTIFGQVVPYDEPFFLTHKPDQTPRFNFKSSPFNVLIENSSYSKANSDGIRHLIKLENIETPKYYIEVESLDINTNQKLFVMDEKSNAFIW